MRQFDFFISYSDKDKQKVEEIIAALEKCGTKCWMAPRDVVGRYAKSIVDAIGNSKVFLLFLSKNSAVSPHVLNEIEAAYNDAYNKKIPTTEQISIEPICIENVDLNDSDFDEIMYYIRRINFIIPKDYLSAKEIAHTIILKNKECLGLEMSPRKKERGKSAYFPSERESHRLKLQTELLRDFDSGIYRKILKKYNRPNILDVGCGNADMIFDRLKASKNDYFLVGVERDNEKVQEAIQKHGNNNVSFCTCDVESTDFSNIIIDKMNSLEIDGFDIINISMLLLHLKSEISLLRKLRRFLNPNGTIIIRDIDDGINFAYPDDTHVFDRIYKICDNNETSGERQNGRSIYTNLYRAGFKKITLEKSGFPTIGLNYEEKEAFWGMYFNFIYEDIKWMRDKYPNNIDIAENCKWYTDNYDDIFDMFMRDDFIFSLGFQIYTAQK